MQIFSATIYDELMHSVICIFLLPASNPKKRNADWDSSKQAAPFNFSLAQRRKTAILELTRHSLWLNCSHFSFGNYCMGKSRELSEANCFSHLLLCWQQWVWGSTSSRLTSRHLWRRNPCAFLFLKIFSSEEKLSNEVVVVSTLCWCTKCLLNLQSSSKLFDKKFSWEYVFNLHRNSRYAK